MTRKIISLFSGAGGMDIGFHQAGFKTVVAVEQDSSCCATLKKNMPDAPIIEGDITQVTTEAILAIAQLKPLESALVVGGPPCQSFSLAGKRMGLDDPRGRLVLEFIRVVRESLPVAFVMENVKGMMNWEGGKALEAILQEASEPIVYQGQTYQYQVNYQVLDAVNYGAPQFRERIFIVGNRVGKNFNFPKPTHAANETIQQVDLFNQPKQSWLSVWDGIGALPPAQEPSEQALKVAGTIKDRIVKHGY
ncbi:MAG: DNA cytosine methyltransferase [Thiofilum sp.]|uniref:DNA cytosine methyltransferase n=1 Tax=Thiofilum sp. TaxID=2212733 RepID=UPI0025E79305|nr:DNA cytosine methyltransferase [Thiofilum sp.]MBK8452356.1 DNA cytosine methyltransferase [Thiofilum sp.]